MADRDHLALDRAEDAEWESSHAIRHLLKDLRSDPAHLPERLAQFAVRELGDRADASVAARQEDDSDLADLQATLATHGVRRTIGRGAVVGGPFMLLIPAAFCAALLAQMRMALELGAAAGWPAADHRRVADLLYLQNVYPSVDEARAALTHMKTSKEADHRSGWFRMVVRMASLLGILSKGPKRSSLRQIGAYLYIIVLFTVGFVAPLIWIPAMAWSYRQATVDLARRAITHFSETDAPSHLDDLERAAAALGSRVSAGMVAGLIRAVIIALTPLVAAVVIIATNTRITGDRWSSGVLGLVVLTALCYLVWVVVRRGLRSAQSR